MIKHLFLPVLLGLLLLFPAAHARPPERACEDLVKLRIALVPQRHMDSLLASYRPLFEHLARKTGRPVEFVPASSYGAVIEGLLTGTIDLAELGPAAYAIARDRGADIVPFASFAAAGSQPPLRAATYHSILIVRKASGWTQLEQLRKRSLSLTDPASTSGALIPRQAVLRLTGQPIEQFFQQVSFSGTHDRALEAVQGSLVDAAFISHSTLNEALQRGRVKPGELAVLWTSPPIPIDPFVYRRSICQPLASKIREAFLDNDERLSETFRLRNKAGFAPVSDETFTEIRALYAPAKP